MSTRTLVSGFLDSCRRHPARIALDVCAAEHSYQELYAASSRIAATLDACSDPGGDAGLTAVFAPRCLSLYAGILAALLRGHGYLPLNPTFLAERCRYMLRRSGCRTLVAASQALPQLRKLLALVSEPLTVVLPDAQDSALVDGLPPAHTVLTARDLAREREYWPRAAHADDPAYLLFTSGSTGRPKGVMITHANVLAFLDWALARYLIEDGDRVSQTFDATFDLSVFDMFTTWAGGARLCCPSRRQLLNPLRFIKDRRLTVWFSVPSLGVLMNRLGSLVPGGFPDLRLSLFCGEALPCELAKAWAAAAPNSIIENLYGPTELTIACTAHRFDAEEPNAHLGWVPIGQPFAHMVAAVCDEALAEVAPGEEGELLVGGPQTARGYWCDEERTAAAFVERPGHRLRFFRTGDRVIRPSGRSSRCVTSGAATLRSRYCSIACRMRASWASRLAQATCGHPILDLLAVEQLHLDAVQAERVAPARELLQLLVAVCEVDDPPRAEHHVEVQRIAHARPQLHREIEEALVGVEQVVRAHHGSVASGVAAAEPTGLEHRGIADAVLLRQIVGAREPVTAAADDERVICASRTGVAPRSWPALVTVQRVADDRAERITGHVVTRNPSRVTRHPMARGARSCSRPDLR